MSSFILKTSFLTRDSDVPHINGGSDVETPVEADTKLEQVIDLGSLDNSNQLVNLEVDVLNSNTTPPLTTPLIAFEDNNSSVKKADAIPGMAREEESISMERGDGIISLHAGRGGCDELTTANTFATATTTTTAAATSSSIPTNQFGIDHFQSHSVSEVQAGSPRVHVGTSESDEEPDKVVSTEDGTAEGQVELVQVSSDFADSVGSGVGVADKTHIEDDNNLTVSPTVSSHPSVEETRPAAGDAMVGGEAPTTATGQTVQTTTVIEESVKTISHTLNFQEYTEPEHVTKKTTHFQEEDSEEEQEEEGEEEEEEDWSSDEDPDLQRSVSMQEGLASGRREQPIQRYVSLPDNVQQDLPDPESHAESFKEFRRKSLTQAATTEVLEEEQLGSPEGELFERSMSVPSDRVDCMEQSFYFSSRATAENVDKERGTLKQAGSLDEDVSEHTPRYISDENETDDDDDDDRASQVEQNLSEEPLDASLSHVKVTVADMSDSGDRKAEVDREVADEGKTQSEIPLDISLSHVKVTMSDMLDNEEQETKDHSELPLDVSLSHVKVTLPEPLDANVKEVTEADEQVVEEGESQPDVQLDASLSQVKISIKEDLAESGLSESFAVEEDASRVEINKTEILDAHQQEEEQMSQEKELELESNTLEASKSNQLEHSPTGMTSLITEEHSREKTKVECTAEESLSAQAEVVEQHTTNASDLSRGHPLTSEREAEDDSEEESVDVTFEHDMLKLGVAGAEAMDDTHQAYLDIHGDDTSHKTTSTGVLSSSEEEEDHLHSENEGNDEDFQLRRKENHASTDVDAVAEKDIDASAESIRQDTSVSEATNTTVITMSQEAKPAGRQDLDASFSSIKDEDLELTVSTTTATITTVEERTHIPAGESGMDPETEPTVQPSMLSPETIPTIAVHTPTDEEKGVSVIADECDVPIIDSVPVDAIEAKPEDDDIDRIDKLQELGQEEIDVELPDDEDDGKNVQPAPADSAEIAMSHSAGETQIQEIHAGIQECEKLYDDHPERATSTKSYDMESLDSDSITPRSADSIISDPFTASRLESRMEIHPSYADEALPPADSGEDSISEQDGHISEPAHLISTSGDSTMSDEYVVPVSGPNVVAEEEDFIESSSDDAGASQVVISADTEQIASVMASSDDGSKEYFKVEIKTEECGEEHMSSDSSSGSISEAGPHSPPPTPAEGELSLDAINKARQEALDKLLKAHTLQEEGSADVTMRETQDFVKHEALETEEEPMTGELEERSQFLVRTVVSRAMEECSTAQKQSHDEVEDSEERLQKGLTMHQEGDGTEHTAAATSIHEDLVITTSKEDLLGKLAKTELSESGIVTSFEDYHTVAEQEVLVEDRSKRSISIDSSEEECESPMSSPKKHKPDSLPSSMADSGIMCQSVSLSSSTTVISNQAVTTTNTSSDRVPDCSSDLTQEAMVSGDVSQSIPHRHDPCLDTTCSDGSFGGFRSDDPMMSSMIIPSQNSLHDEGDDYGIGAENVRTQERDSEGVSVERENLMVDSTLHSSQGSSDLIVSHGVVTAAVSDRYIPSDSSSNSASSSMDSDSISSVELAAGSKSDTGASDAASPDQSSRGIIGDNQSSQGLIGDTGVGASLTGGEDKPTRPPILVAESDTHTLPARDEVAPDDRLTASSEGSERSSDSEEDESVADIQNANITIEPHTAS